MVYYRPANATTWTLDSNTEDSSHVIDTVLFLPTTAFQVKVNARYVVNGEVFISDDSDVFSFTIPGK